MTECPRCGALNPGTNKFCGECGQALAAAVPPVAPPPRADLPDWLRDDAPPAAAPAAPAPAAPREELPAWLRDVGVEDEPAASAETPDWLAEIQQSAAPSQAAPVSQSHDELTEWLRADLDSAAPTPPDAPADEAPEWLRASAAPQQAPAAQPPDELPEWLRSADDEPSAPAAPASTSGEVPAWLHDEPIPPSDAHEQSAAPVPDSGGDDLPPWLRDETPAPPAARVTATNAVPAWLDEPAAPLSAAAAPPADAVAADDLPPWLRDESTAAASPPSAPASDELPPWLREDAASASAPTPSAAAPGDDELPAWFQEQGAPATAESQPTQTADELPAWLRDDAPTPPPAAAVPEATDFPAWLADQPAAQSAGVAPQPEAVPDDAAPDLALPAWLTADAPAPAPAPAPTPATDLSIASWLEDDTAPQTAPAPTAAAPSGSGDALDMPVPDWGAELGEAAPTAQMPAAAADETLPAWLADTSATGSIQPSAPVSAGTADFPAWLLEESPTLPSADSAVTNEPAPALDDAARTDELPAWLTTDLDAAPATTPASDASVPAWLEESAPAEPTAAPERGATQQIPAWLLDEPLAPAAAPSLVPTPAGGGDDLPPWLSDMGVEDQPAAAQPAGAADDDGARVYDAPPAPNAESTALPAWLGADDSDGARVYDAPDTAAVTPAPATPPASDVELPAWLSEAAPAPSAAEPQSGALPAWLSDMPDEPAPAAAAGTLPAWLEEPEKPAVDAPAPAGNQSELLGGLDLPAWLREDSSAVPPTAPVAEAAPTWLQRADAEAEEAPPSAALADVPARPRIQRSAERVAAAHMLEQLIAQPAAEPEARKPARRRPRALTVILVLVILAIVAAALVILVGPRFGLDFGIVAAPSLQVAAAAQVLAALPANRPVLLAYEWDTQRAGELRPLEDAVLSQLASRKDVPLLLVSTDPQGAAFAGQRAAVLDALGDSYHLNGLGYADLGFKPGGALALQRFAPDAAFADLLARDAGGVDLRANDVTVESVCGAPTAADCSWDDVSLLVLMADDVDDVRGWFEQVRAAHPNLQTLLLTTAEIGPQVQPYATLPGVTRLSGIADAAAYAEQSGAQSERLARQADATAVGKALFAVAAVLGGIPAVVIGRRARRAELD